MDLEKIQALMNQFEDSDLRELKIDDGDFHFYLSKNKNKVTQTVQPTVQKTAKKQLNLLFKRILTPRLNRLKHLSLELFICRLNLDNQPLLMWAIMLRKATQFA